MNLLEVRERKALNFWIAQLHSLKCKQYALADPLMKIYSKLKNSLPAISCIMLKIACVKKTLHGFLYCIISWCRSPRIWFFPRGTFSRLRNEDILSSTSNTLFSKQLLWKMCFMYTSGMLLSLTGSSEEEG